MLTRGMIGVCTVLLVAVCSYAAPLSVRIDDYDFTFDTPEAVARYDFNGTAADTLSLAPGGGPEVGSLSVTGVAPGPLAAGFYGVYQASGVFGGDLSLNLNFLVNDGPYTSPSGDSFDVSLVGDNGFLRIVGGVFHGFPGVVDVPADVTLLEINFDKTTLLARDGVDRADLIEARGIVTKLMGQDIADQNHIGVLKMAFYGEEEIFPDFVGGIYDPTDDIQDTIFGRISGETGLVPEPMTMGILALGLPFVLLRRRRR